MYVKYECFISKKKRGLMFYALLTKRGLNM